MIVCDERDQVSRRTQCYGNPAEINSKRSNPVVEDKEETDTVQFEPPVNRLRYSFVAELLRLFDCRKVADFGCGTMKLFSHYLRQNLKLELYRGVDIDIEELKRGVPLIVPRAVDYLAERENELEVEVFQADILAAENDNSLIDARFFDLDCVILIEVTISLC